MPGVVSTSIAAELGERSTLPTTASVERAARDFARVLAGELAAPLEGP
jgi:hypothetical protein